MVCLLLPLPSLSKTMCVIRHPAFHTLFQPDHRLHISIIPSSLPTLSIPRNSESLTRLHPQPLSPLSHHLACDFARFDLPGWNSVARLCNTPYPFHWTRHFYLSPLLTLPALPCIPMPPGRTISLSTRPLWDPNNRGLLLSLVVLLCIYC